MAEDVTRGDFGQGQMENSWKCLENLVREGKRRM